MRVVFGAEVTCQRCACSGGGQAGAWRAHPTRVLPITHAWALGCSVCVYGLWGAACVCMGFGVQRVCVCMFDCGCLIMCLCACARLRTHMFRWGAHMVCPRQHAAAISPASIARPPANW